MDASMSIGMGEVSKTSSNVHSDQRAVYGGAQVGAGSGYLGGSHGCVHGCVHVRCAG